jgi:hypothetical protein
MAKQSLSIFRPTLSAMVLLAIGTHLHPQTTKEPAFRVCLGTYALCTNAICEPDGKGGFTCKCDVMQELSAGARKICATPSRRFRQNQI